MRGGFRTVSGTEPESGRGSFVGAAELLQHLRVQDAELRTPVVDRAGFLEALECPASAFPAHPGELSDIALSQRQADLYRLSDLGPAVLGQPEQASCEPGGGIANVALDGRIAHP